MASSSARPPPPRSIVVGVPKEILPLEKRVAVVPDIVKKLRKLGCEVLVESGAGEGATYADASYAEAGARIVDAKTLYAEAQLVLKVRAPTDAEVDQLREGTALVSFIWPAHNKPLLEKLAAKKATVLAMDAVPRITRAQKLDALSAMGNIAGYRAVVEGAALYGRFLGGQITAAGRVRPAQVFIIGAGVAGLAAIGAAKSLGAVVKAFDTRAASREQVESLGAIFVPMELTESGEGEGGYAKEMSEAFLQAEQALLATHAKDSDIVITTALIPGKKAPVLLTSGAVVGMHAGSVIVDLAAEQGGNCALTERDRVVEKFGVQIVGATDLTSRMSLVSSELYATCLLHLLEDFVEPGVTEVEIDMDDEVQRSMTVVHAGAITWPPPKPVVRAGAPSPQAGKTGTTHAPVPRKESPWPVRIGLSAALVMLALLAVMAPPGLLSHVTVFVLACVVGWHLIWNVTPALHTPLMSVTNAISGIILLGGLLLGVRAQLDAPAILASIAVLVATINVAGGFLVTQRMLKMFAKRGH